MDEVEVQVVQLEVLEGGLAGWKDVLPRMVRAPLHSKTNIGICNLFGPFSEISMVQGFYG